MNSNAKEKAGLTVRSKVRRTSRPQPTASGQQLSPTPVVEVERVLSAEFPVTPIISGIKTHYAAAIAFITSAGGGTIALFKGLPPSLIYAFFGAAAFIACAYILSRVWLRNQENDRQLERDRMAHELTLAQLKTAADRNALTVKVTG